MKFFPFVYVATLLVAIIPGYFASTDDHHNTHYAPNRSTIVHLFEWKFNDIADECERYLGPNGFAGVQLSPVNENAIIKNRPWWERYQPISYKIATRSGDENEFKSMVNRCNAVGVRIYVDVVVNHMTGQKGMIVGTGGTTVKADSKVEFPGVPYGPDDFHPSCAINNYQNAGNVRDCELVGLPDLNQGRPNVQQVIVEFINHLISGDENDKNYTGIAGIRMDAVKHMKPEHLQSIYSQLRNLNEKTYGPNAKLFIYQEVIDLGGEAVKKSDYTHMGVVTEFVFSEKISNSFRGNNKLKYLINWGPEWGMLPSRDALVFVDNHDNQRAEDKPYILTYKSRQQYIMAVAFMLAHPYGIPRVMSSFEFRAFDQGPPTDSDENIVSPKINPTTEQCENGWVCEHRWPEIRNMVKFRNAVGTASLSSKKDWWDNGNNQIAFFREKRGYVAFNNEKQDLNKKLKTSLPKGDYCDVISGQMIDNRCTGRKVHVDEKGEADILVSPSVGVLAIHINAKLK